MPRLAAERLLASIHAAFWIGRGGTSTTRALGPALCSRRNLPSGPLVGGGPDIVTLTWLPFCSTTTTGTPASGLPATSTIVPTTIALAARVVSTVAGVPG